MSDEPIYDLSEGAIDLIHQLANGLADSVVRQLSAQGKLRYEETELVRALFFVEFVKATSRVVQKLSTR